MLQPPDHPRAESEGEESMQACCSQKTVSSFNGMQHIHELYTYKNAFDN